MVGYKERFVRSAMLITEQKLERLRNARVAVCGLGGVGSYAAEALARSGIGSMIIIDCDTVDTSNLNRQLPALCSTVGLRKTDVMKSRLSDINPELSLKAENLFLSPETDREIFNGCDYIVDAVDNVTAKLWLAETAKAMNIPIIASMGCANKLDASLLEIADIRSTSMCPLCRVMRRELKARGIDKLTVVYSKEPPVKPQPSDQMKGNHPAPSSMIFVPASAGLLMAQHVVRTVAGV